MFHCAPFEMTFWVILSKGLFEWLYSALVPFWIYGIIYSHETETCSYCKVKDGKSTHAASHALKEIWRNIEKINKFCVFKHTHTKHDFQKIFVQYFFLSCLPSQKPGCYHIKAVSVKSAPDFSLPLIEVVIKLSS